ncbi:TRAP transporter small permease, partial [bacterium]|nr:TRAP transporter small permease [bacterium]
MKQIIVFYRQFENFILYFLLTLLILLSFAQVAGRLFFNIGFPDADPVICHLVLWLGMVGAVLATREKEHITIDVVSRFVSGRLLCIIQVITGLFTSAVCGFLTWIAVRFIRDEIQYCTMEIIGLPLWVFQLIIPVSFGLMSIRFSIETVEKIIRVFQPL